MKSSKWWPHYEVNQTDDMPSRNLDKTSFWLEKILVKWCYLEQYVLDFLPSKEHSRNNQRILRHQLGNLNILRAGMYVNIDVLNLCWLFLITFLRRRQWNDEYFPAKSFWFEVWVGEKMFSLVTRPMGDRIFPTPFWIHRSNTLASWVNSSM